MKMYGDEDGKKGVAKSVWAVKHNLEVSQNLAVTHLLYIPLSLPSTVGRKLPSTVGRKLSHSPELHCPRCCLNTKQKDCQSLAWFTITAYK